MIDELSQSTACNFSDSPELPGGPGSSGYGVWTLVGKGGGDTYGDFAMGTGYGSAEGDGYGGCDNSWAMGW